MFYVDADTGKIVPTGLNVTHILVLPDGTDIPHPYPHLHELTDPDELAMLKKMLNGALRGVTKARGVE
jgi:hypothetical protein